MPSVIQARWQIHFCVLLWGFTAILGKLITLPALPLVWWRMLLVTASLALLPKVWRGLRAMPPRLLLAYCGIGTLVALHWLTFYGAIKLSNASVGATCIALGTPMTALLEPWLAGRPFSWRDVLLGVAVLPGVALVVGGVPDGMHAGIAVGALSALLVAIFGSLNKRFVEHGEPLAITALELGAGAVLLTALAPLMPLLFPAFSGPLFSTLPGVRDLGFLLGQIEPRGDTVGHFRLGDRKNPVGCFDVRFRNGDAFAQGEHVEIGRAGTGNHRECHGFLRIARGLHLLIRGAQVVLCAAPDIQRPARIARKAEGIVCGAPAEDILATGRLGTIRGTTDIDLRP